MTGIPMRRSKRRAAALACVLVFAGLLPGADAFSATEIGARLERERIEAGASTALVVTITDPSEAPGEPQVSVPDGLEVLGTSRMQSYSWVNGKSTSQVIFRIEIEALDPGRYTIGPIRVTVGRQTYMGGTRTLVVADAGAAAPAGPGGSVPRASAGPGPRANANAASLQMELQPREPYVGQMCLLTVRLVQRVEMSEDSQYESPPTPGFWTESWSEPVQYQAREGSRPVLVVERHLRLYPLAAGRGEIGSARGLVTPSGNMGLPGLVFSSGNPLPVETAALPVRVRPLPPGAPAGFDGAVGTFTVSWTCDRSHTTADQPVTMSLDVRGTGNLPLLHTPKLSGADFDVFGATTDDSLAPQGSTDPGRRRFAWTVLPKRTGSLRVASPVLAWFDPNTGAYRTAALPPVELDVAAALPGAAENDGFPKVFATGHPSPGSRAARPWALLLAGLAAGAAVQFVRLARSAPPDVVERARQREWLRAVGLARGPDFWRAADEAAAWVESRGQRVMRLREEISAARFGGASAVEDDLRRRLIERLGEALPPEAPRTRPWGFAAGCALAALLALALGVPGCGDARLAARVRAADAQARAGRVSAAAAEWRRVAQEAPDPDVSARVAWAALEAGDVGAASAAIVAGQSGEARRGALRWATDRVREGGGLVGLAGRPLPLTSWEWGALACALALGAGLEWSRRRLAAALFAAAVLAAAAWPAEQFALEHPPQRALAREATLEGAGVELQAGQVVRVLGAHAGRLLVRAAPGVEGTLAPDDLVGARARP